MAALRQILSGSLAILLALLLRLPGTQSGESVLTITFNWYENQDDKLSDGNLCDTTFQGLRDSSCDPTFRFEIMREGGSAETLFSYTQEGQYTDKTRIDFSARIGNQKNPIELDVQMKEELDIFLKIRVEDYDHDGKNDLMDIFVHMLAKTMKRTDIELTSKTTAHRFQFSYQYVCKVNYFGQLCTKLCVPRDDDTWGHYLCSLEGDKICRPGWMNIDEDCKVPDWCRWC